MIKVARRTQKAQSMVEMALCIPLLLLTLVGIMYFGRAYFITQTVTYAAQEAAKLAARIPNLSDPNTRDYVRGFTTGGAASNNRSIVYSIMAGAMLLSNGNSGDLPPRASVKILPYDATDSQDITPPGTISVVVTYPMSLLANPFTGQPSGETQSVSIAQQIDDPNPVTFGDFVIRQSATVSPQIYQEGI